MKQADLFYTETQDDLFAAEPVPVVFRADPEKVRAELHLMLAEVRGARIMPWSPSRLGYHQTVFPQMCRWLPDEEAQQLCFAFEEEIKRLAAA